MSTLTDLQASPDSLSSVQSELTTEEVSSLQPLLSTLIQQQTALREKDTTLFKQFTQRQSAINESREKDQKEIRDRKERLHADKVYLAECREAVSEQIESASSEQERQRFKQDLVLVDQEWEKIDTDEKTIANDENEYEERYARDMDALQEMRSQQVTEVNTYRDKVKQQQASWNNQIEQLLNQRREKRDVLLSEVNNKQSELVALNDKHEQLVRQQGLDKEEAEQMLSLHEEEKQHQEQLFKERLRDKEREVEALQERRGEMVKEMDDRKTL